jgi:hypothetical protein
MYYYSEIIAARGENWNITLSYVYIDYSPLGSIAHKLLNG